MAEALLRHLSKGQVEAHSAGTHPQPHVHPMAKVTLARRYGLSSDDLFPKRIDAFAGQTFDYVITVCDRAAETCPVFPGKTERIHWSFPDPAAAVGIPDEQQRAFDMIAADIEAHLAAWLATPMIAARVAGA